MNKIVVYDPKNLNGLTIPAYFNAELKNVYENKKIEFLTFIFKDLSENLKNQNKFISDYKEFMLEWKLPYSFFPYYIYFNKQLPNLIAKPNPRLTLNIKNEKKIDVIVTPAYGFLMLDLNKLREINFYFNESYTELYYLQDMIQKCYENKLWISNCCFIDRYESWKDLKEQTTQGLLTNNEKFQNEKIEYDKQNFTYHSIQEFIVRFKEAFN